MTEAESAEYLQAAEQVIGLAQTVILTPDAIPLSDVDVLLDQRTGLVLRATNNVAGVAYRSVASHLGHDLNDHKQIETVLNPVEPRDDFAIFGAVAVSTEDVLRGVFHVSRHYTEHGKLATGDAVVPLYIRDAVSPNAVVINGAMPVIVKLVRTLSTLNGENTEATIDRLRQGHHKMLGG